MSRSYSISLELNPKPEHIQILGDGIIDYAKQKTSHQPMEFFAVFVRDSNQAILGGCSGSTLYGCLYIDQLWVAPLLRSQGYGRQLMEKALEFGLAKQCTFATVNTFDWEALGFYQQLGFDIEFQRTGFAYQSIFYFLRRALIPASTLVNSLENKVFPWQQDTILCSIVEELKIKHHCHTILLYGSRARGDFSKTSDYDVVGITQHQPPKKWLARFDEVDQVFLDIFVFAEQELIEPNESHLHMSDGVVLIEHHHYGTRLLEKLKSLLIKPVSISDDERSGRYTWYQKMLARSLVDDLEGNHRKIWAIYALLEDYFAFRNRRYLGPKKAFQYLQENDPDTLKLFDHVQRNTDDLVALEKLILSITTKRTQ